MGKKREEEKEKAKGERRAAAMYLYPAERSRQLALVISGAGYISGNSQVSVEEVVDNLACQRNSQVEMGKLIDSDSHRLIGLKLFD